MLAPSTRAITVARAPILPACALARMDIQVPRVKPWLAMVVDLEFVKMECATVRVPTALELIAKPKLNAI
jgi:hypothetical protein